MKKACFLDRDGVLIEEVNYIKSPEQVKIIPAVFSALKKLREKGYLCIVISNQSGVARGYFKEENISKIQDRIDELLKEKELKIDGYYNCPHHPDGIVPEYRKNCDCRKPRPGMIIRAAKEHSIDLSKSFMIGDKISDIKAAENAGCHVGIMVRTGHGEDQISSQDTKDITVVADIREAVEYYFRNF
ncbi:MAG: hypothetical protein A2017_16700 [Lentisphaerae bacterium GWF2_44_16]|nr:MAG: hypothetical protein A2017_16700 [Lentisphaerae bacterium GWF2_44_16]